MDQKTPQNIDELLQLLKTTVDNTEADSEREGAQAVDHVSNAQMQSELKKLYLHADMDYDAPEEDHDYVLDDDFLREINGETQKKKSSSRSRVASSKEDTTATEDVIEEVVLEESLVEAEDLAPWDEMVTESIEEDEIIEADEIIEVDEIIEEDEILEEDEIIEEDAFIDEGVILEAADFIDEEGVLEADEIVEEEKFVEGAADVEEPKMQAMDLSSLGLQTREEEPIFEDQLEEQVPEEDLGTIDLMFDTSKPQKQQADPSVVDLLLQFGCEDELEENVEEEQIYEYLNLEGSDIPYDAETSYVYDGREYVSAEQKDALAESYRHNLFSSIRRLIGVSALSLIVFLYDLLPLLDVAFLGFLDYAQYPVAYLLFGLQLLLVCCIPIWRKLWRSLRSLCHFRFDTYSVAIVSVLAVLIYDLSSLYMAERDLPLLFHFVAALGLAVATVSDHLLLCREKITFRIYSEEGAAYTLLKSEGKDSIADKMYRGGLPHSHTVRVPADVDFPNCYFRSVCEDRQKPSVMRYLAVPLLVLSVLCAVACIILDEGMFSSISAMPVVLLAALPSSAILADSIVLYAAALKLKEKGCAIAGKGAIDRYADTNLMVFRDRHLFASCQSEDVGVVFYDSKDTKMTLSCLKALYDIVGGPMASVLSRIPSEYESGEVKIIRMFRNGMEAVIAKKHVLIVGDSQFMERYGFDFSEESDRTLVPGRAMLCVSLDGKKTAKLTVKYTLEPLFEVLVERLAEEGIYCAVETQDPLIHSAMASALRTRGHTPISIIHKSAREIRKGARQEENVRKEPTGILAHRSRLYLAELAILCKRLRTIRRRIAIGTVIGGALFFAGFASLLLLGLGEWANQYVLLLCHGAVSLLLIVGALLHLPHRNHISLASYNREQSKKENK